MEKRLIDSDILIDHLRGLPAAKDFLLACLEERDALAVSVASVVELYAAKSALTLAGKIGLDEFIDYFRKIDLDIYIAKEAGLLRARYGLGFADAAIAASAAADGAVLVTRNLKHFEKVKHLIQIHKPY